MSAEVKGPLILWVDKVAVADHASLAGGLLRLEVVRMDRLLRGLRLVHGVEAHDSAEVNDLLILVGPDHGLLVAHDLTLAHRLDAAELRLVCLLLVSVEEELLVSANLLPSLAVS